MSSENKNKFLSHLPLCVFRSLGRGPAQNNSALFVRHRKKYRYFADFARIRHRPRTKEDKHGTGSLSCFIFDRAAAFRRGIGLLAGTPTPSRFPCQIRAKTRISGRLTDVGGLTLDSGGILVKSLRFRMG